VKCGSCYAGNAAWAAVCVMCGEPVVPVELCANGHILPPGSRDCPVCPSMWPDVAPFVGPPLLRGVLWVERGRLKEGESGRALPYLEVRDLETPLTFDQAAPDELRLAPAEAKSGVARILMRPDGVSVCEKAGGRSGKPAYVPVVAGEILTLGGVRIRFVPFEVPGRPD
jgi:hypothetical protein